jgi:hypothetical protein
MTKDYLVVSPRNIFVVLPGNAFGTLAGNVFVTLQRITLPGNVCCFTKNCFCYFTKGICFLHYHQGFCLYFLYLKTKIELL